MAYKSIPAHAQGDQGFYKCTYKPDIVYRTVDGIELKLQLIVPMQSETLPPLVVYIQGSGWAKQDTYLALPQLSQLTCHGFAVASVAYRDTSITTFPANAEDTKAAVRFLRAHAEEFGFDGSRIGAWGTSSGGHTAAMLGVSEGFFGTEDYADQSDAVQAVVDFYGPTDLLHLDDYPGAMLHASPDSPESMLIGGPLMENPEKAIQASPITYVSPEQPIPPFLIFHGDMDDKVHFSQSERFCAALLAAGKDAELIRIIGGKHGDDGGVMGPDTLPLVIDFFTKHLKEETL